MVADQGHALARAGRNPFAARPLAALWCALVILLALPGVSRAALAWSAPRSLNELNAPGMADVVCPSTSECVAVEGPGYPERARADEVTYNPSTPSGWTAYTVDRGNSPTAVACPSRSVCTAVESGGREVTFTPASPHRPVPYTIDPGHTLRAISCPSTVQCTAIDGDGRAVTFDPAQPRATRPLQVDGMAVSALSCPSTSQCTAVDGFGRFVTFDPLTPGKAHVSAVLGNVYFADVACPSVGECVATGVFSCVSEAVACSAPAGGGQEVTFDPTNVSATSTTASTKFELYGVDCPSSTQCSAMDSTGHELTFDPARPDAMSRAPVDGSVAGNGPVPTAISCADVTHCSVVDLISGVELSFDARAPGRPEAVSIATGAANVGVACPTAGSCTAIAAAAARADGKRVVFETFAAISPRQSRPHLIAAGTPSALACPSQRQCTTVDTSGRAFTFNPSRPPPSATTAALRRIDSAGLRGVACPSIGQCTAVDSSGREITFAPGAARVSTVRRIDQAPLTGIACPSLGQCTAIDSRGSEVTFIPGTPVAATIGRVDGSGLTSLSCPSLGQCTAVDARGGEVTFNPGNPHQSSSMRIDGAALSSISCPTLTFCVAADGHGAVIEGKPGATTRWTVQPLSGADAPMVVSCSSASQCVALDDDGHEFVGRG